MKIPRAASVYSLFLACTVVASAEPRRPPRPAGAVPKPPASGVPGDVERGRYIAERVAMCVQCHSPRDGAGNIIAGQEYTGGVIPFRPPWPNDWADRAPRNRGLPGYTRELAMRLLMAGAIDREDRQLRPPMPAFRMTPQDAADVVAFLMSLP